MRSVARLLCLMGGLVLAASCGGEASPDRSPSASQALTNAAELLEFESPARRQELFRDVARTSMLQAGQEATEAVLFPLVLNGQVHAAPGFDGKDDLLQAPDAGQLSLTFEGGGETWPADRHESLQGLSEREAAELVSRTLLTRWGVESHGTIEVTRVSGAPYAAAYLDGSLRLNPAFLYLVAAVGPSAPAANQ